MIVPEMQRVMAARMKATVRSHAVDHTPIVTAPALVAAIIREAISASCRAEPGHPTPHRHDDLQGSDRCPRSSIAPPMSTASRCSIARPDRRGAPKLLLLHGFPSAGHMFRDLIPLLADRFHIVAPDLPGFGQSDMPRARQVQLHVRQHRRA